jgi:nucleoside phosphorylase
MEIILTATNLETKLANKWKEETNSNFYVYQTGVGRTNVLLALCHLTSEMFDDCGQCTIKQIVNIGLCGCNVEEGKIYDIVIPSNFKDGDRNWFCDFTKNDMYPMLEHHNGSTLVTTSQFIKKDIYDGYFYDMEAFDILAFCREFDITFSCFKIVSDYCNKTSEVDYQSLDENKLYEKFKEALDGCRWN